jgi:hypothetical protein
MVGGLSAAPATPARVLAPKDPAALSRAAVIWVYISLGASVFGALSSATILLSGGAEALSPPIALVAALSAILMMVVLLGCGFVVLKWIYRVNLNAKVLAPDKTISPGWAVVWYFVPFAALWKPYQAIRETWQISTDGAAWRTAAYPVLLRQWWGLWIVTNILGNVSLRLSMSHDLAGAAAIGDVCDLVSDLVDIPLDLIFIALIRQLTALQIGALSSRSFD